MDQERRPSGAGPAPVRRLGVDTILAGVVLFAGAILFLALAGVQKRYPPDCSCPITG